MPNPVAPPIRVLHVDDEPGLGDLTARFLEREDARIEVVTATSAADGLDCLADHDIDCIVSDYRMPGMDGLEFLAAVRDDHPDLPFVLFTGEGSEAIASEAITAGATDYLRKRTGTEQYELLANRVSNAVEQYRSKRRAAALERVRTLASDVNQALVRAESRAEIEARVPEVLTDADPYRFAAIAEVDPETERVDQRASAGVAGGFLDGDGTHVDDGDEGRSAIERAVHGRELAIVRNLQGDTTHEPWRELAVEYGLHALAAVPLEHEDTLYGLFVVVSGRPNAFDDTERKLLAELGDNIAHALHAHGIKADLRRSRDRFEALFENAPVPVLTGEIRPDDDRQIVRDANDAFEDVFGFESEEVVGRDVADVVVPEGSEERHAAFRERAAAGEPVDAEVSRSTVDGLREFLLQVIPIGTEGDRADGWYAWYTDVTEQKRREERLTHQQSLFEAVMETTIDGVLVVDRDREYVTWNQQFIDMWDIPEGMIGDEPESVALEWVLDELEAPDAFLDTVEHLYDHPDEESRDRVRLTDGRVFDRYSAPVEGDDGTHYGRVWFFRDITEQREREDALERLHAATRDLMAATTTEEVVTTGSGMAADILELPMNSIHLFDPAENALVPVACSDALESVFDGLPPSIPAGEGVAWQAYATGDSQVHADVREADRVLNEDTPFRHELHLPLGDHGVLIVASTACGEFDAADEALAHVLAANVEAALDRVEYERTLAEERDKYETLVEESHDAVAIHQDGKFVFANERCLEMLGYEESELVGEPISAIVVPEDRALVVERYERRIDPDAESPPSRYEARFLTADGEERIAEISAARIRYEGDPAVLVTIRDVTDRNRYEERLEETTEELEALNRVVRHDIRNDVSIMLGWARLLDDHVDDTGREYLEKVLASGEHIVDLTETAREYIETLTSEDELAVRPTPLRSVLRTELDLRRESYPDAEFVLAGEIPDVSVTANEMLGAVFRNLLNNAVQHNDADEPVVTVACEMDDGAVVVRIADDGPGVPDGRKDAVFGKNETGLGSPGSGIGLYLVRTLVDQYDGDVWIEDNAPRGAVFNVRLPKAG
jgi:PAS domain S-box-containing protein